MKLKVIALYLILIENKKEDGYVYTSMKISLV